MRQYTYYMYEKNGQKCVTAVTHYRGQVVRGTAICRTPDVYDEEKGKKIAALKCSKKVLERRLAFFQDAYKQTVDAAVEISAFAGSVSAKLADTKAELLNVSAELDSIISA